MELNNNQVIKNSDTFEYGDPMENNQIFVDVYWFNGGGIVCTFDKYEKKYKCYIGSSRGETAKKDSQVIASYGSKFALEAFMVLASNIDFRLDVYEETIEKQL